MHLINFHIFFITIVNSVQLNSYKYSSGPNIHFFWINKIYLIFDKIILSVDILKYENHY